MTGERGSGERAATPGTALAYLQLAAKFLAGRGDASPRLDAELLLAKVLATDRVGVYLRFDRPLAASEVDAYRVLVRRRGEGEPVAHLTGRREFWSQSLVVTPEVLIPRPESELLVECALAAIGARDRRLRVLDLGTGSGALACALAGELPGASVVAVDLSLAAARVARDNVVALGLAPRVHVVVGDWNAGLAPAARFDVIVANPPYVPAAELAGLPPEVQREPRLALDGGADGLAAYRRLVPAAGAALAPNGTFLLEVGAGQAGAVANLLDAAGFTEVTCHRDLAAIERVLAATAPPSLAAKRAASS